MADVKVYLFYSDLVHRQGVQERVSVGDCGGETSSGRVSTRAPVGEDPLACGSALLAPYNTPLRNVVLDGGGGGVGVLIEGIAGVLLRLRWNWVIIIRR